MKTQERDGMKGLKSYEQSTLLGIIVFIFGKLAAHKIGHALGWW